MGKCVKELTASLVIDVSGDHPSLPNRNFLEMATVPSPHNSGQAPKEKKKVFSQPQIPPAVSPQHCSLG